jgi:alanine racemase
MPRPIQACIDLSALENNLKVVKRYAASRVMAVVKANAYGHGLLRTVEALAAADGFALLDLQDAIALREHGVRQPILLLEGYFSAADVPLLAEYALSTVIHSPHQLPMLDAYPQRGTLDVWLKINSGMNRLGIDLCDAPAVIERLRTHPAVKNVTLMTHFSHADEPRGVAEQWQRFCAVSGGHALPVSAANSAAILRYPHAHGDWVRPGIMLYGSSPFADVSADALGLRTVMTLSSEVIAVKTLQNGEYVGYGGLFKANAPTRVGVVACGYADGYPRHAPTGTPIQVAGQRTRTLGRVSMDMLCVDLSHLPEADVGSRVVMWGQGMPVDEVARAAGTISYELLCAVAARVPFVSC